MVCLEMVCVGGVWGLWVGMMCGTACLGTVYVDGVLGDGGGVYYECMCVCMYVCIYLV